MKRLNQLTNGLQMTGIWHPESCLSYLMARQALRQMGQMADGAIL
jgi:hypothetical protein